MAEFLSPEWVAALDTAAQRSTALVACAETDSFVLEQRVVLPDGSEAVHHLRLTGDAARVLPGPAAHADVVLTTDVDTAVALARGDTNAQTALATGRLQVGGRLDALTRRAEALAAVDDVFKSVRAETSFPATGAPGPHR